jgi:hypothetical protein
MMNRRDLYSTLLAGAIGGLAANITVFYNPAVWAALGPASLFEFVLGPVLLGALAAGIGVFVLTKTDTSDVVRTFFFAVICGLAFPQVIAVAKNTFSGRAEAELAAHALEESAERLRQLVAQTSPNRNDIAETTSLVRDLSNRVESTDARHNALAALQNAADKLTGPADKSIAVDAMKDIGINAAAKRDWETTLKAVGALQNIQRTAPAAAQAEVSSAQGELIARLPDALHRTDETAQKSE